MTPPPVVTDRALARLAGHAARSTAGVVRCAQSDVRVERGTHGCTVTVAVTTRTRPPVLEIVDALQREVQGALAELAATTATVDVHVLDVEPGDTDRARLG